MRSLVAEEEVGAPWSDGDPHDRHPNETHAAAMASGA
jgi:hypothetical protein